jgi:hypothetical protein
MHKNATKCHETLSKWCKHKHGASKIMDTLETYQSRLDKDSYECYFAHGKCAIWFKDACVGIALLHNELYLLSLREKVHSVCNMNEQTVGIMP